MDIRHLGGAVKDQLDRAQEEYCVIVTKHMNARFSRRMNGGHDYER